MRYNKLRVHFDGACDNRSKLKLMGSGISAFVQGEFIEGRSEAFGGGGTSNIAEYQALIMALKYCISYAKDNNLQHHTVVIIGDSQLVIRQMQGLYRVKNPLLRDFYEEAKILEVQLQALVNVKHLTYEWVRRERNTVADEYSKEGLAKNFV